MRTIGIISHVYNGESVIFSLERLLNTPFYFQKILPINTKVVFEYNSDSVYISSILKLGKSIYDKSDDDELLTMLYDLKEINIDCISENDPFDRKNLEELFVCTIDPDGSKDLDDALSIKNDILYIHIADVLSYFVDNMDILINTIFPRANTIYFRNSNIPMIGRNLSDDKISLIPGSVKRAITLEFDINTLELKNVYPSSISNNCKLTYQNVDSILNGKLHKNQDINSLISGLKSVYDKLKTKTKIHINISSVSHQIIEEIMILANQSIAKKLNNTVYRFHNQPYPNKAGYLQRFIGCQTGQFINLDINEISQSLDTVPQRKTVNYLVKHMMSKAIYTQENKSHWALNLSHYSHFTSPIRRAADIIVHMNLLLENSSIDCSKYIDKLNEGEELQKSIESILDELTMRRSLEKSKFFSGCIIKVLPNEVEYYIPELDITQIFHISECSCGEFLTYFKDSGGKLSSQNYDYYLGKCNNLYLESFNIASGKKVFKIIDDNLDNKLL